MTAPVSAHRLPLRRGATARRRTGVGHRRRDLRRRLPALLPAAALWQQLRLPDAVPGTAGPEAAPLGGHGRPDHAGAGLRGHRPGRASPRRTSTPDQPVPRPDNEPAAANAQVGCWPHFCGHPGSAVRGRPHACGYPGRTSAATVAADLRPNPDIPTDTPPPPPPERRGERHRQRVGRSTPSRPGFPWSS
jgi:hypothetical protein